MPVVTTTVEVHDNLTGTTHKIPAYHLWYNQQGNIALAAAVTFFILFPMPETLLRKTGMARSDYDIINLSLEHELKWKWLAERLCRRLVDNRNHRRGGYPEIGRTALYKRFPGMRWTRHTVNTRRKLGLSPGMRINKWIMLPSGSVIATGISFYSCFFPGSGLNFSPESCTSVACRMRIRPA